MNETCVATREVSTTKHPFRRFISMMLAMIMVISTVIVPASAATSKTKTVNSSCNLTSFSITSGSGWRYSCGLSKTTVTVKNTGNYTVTMYELTSAGCFYWKGDIRAGQTKTLTMSGSGRKSTLQFQKSGRGNSTVTVSVSAGSVS